MFNVGHEVTVALEFAASAFVTSFFGKNTSPRLNLLLNEGSAYDIGCFTPLRLLPDPDLIRESGPECVPLAIASNFRISSLKFLFLAALVAKSEREGPPDPDLSFALRCCNLCNTSVGLVSDLSACASSMGAIFSSVSLKAYKYRAFAAAIPARLSLGGDGGVPVPLSSYLPFFGEGVDIIESGELTKESRGDGGKSSSSLSGFDLLLFLFGVSLPFLLPLVVRSADVDLAIDTPRCGGGGDDDDDGFSP
mmetsp:Transcript_18721/g.22946  ORF Transcript_18721/g.22946 Transcript_18721/m.22946 type:complete len:250 (+) Transcript_18721:143-892(+)